MDFEVGKVSVRIVEPEPDFKFISMNIDVSPETASCGCCQTEAFCSLSMEWEEFWY